MKNRSCSAMINTSHLTIFWWHRSNHDNGFRCLGIMTATSSTWCWCKRMAQPCLVSLDVVCAFSVQGNLPKAVIPHSYLPDLLWVK